jgi:hypothetical protein
MSIYQCTFPDCSVKGHADQMWNFPARKGESCVVVCGRHAAEGRKRGLRAYRLSETLAWEEAQVAKARAFFDPLVMRTRTVAPRVR